MPRKKKILVILGGNSKEREISLETGKSCIRALKKAGYKTVKFDPKLSSITEINQIYDDFVEPTRDNYYNFVTHTPSNTYKKENPYETHKETANLCHALKKLPQVRIRKRGKHKTQ